MKGLKQVLASVGKGQADLARAVKLSPAAIAQLINHGQWPKSIPMNQLAWAITEYLMQQWAGFLYDHFGQLHDGGDRDDERQGAQVFQPERREQEVVDHVAGTGGHREHERGGRTHAECGVEFLGNAHERAQSEDLHQDDVIDQHGADDDEQVMSHDSCGETR